MFNLNATNDIIGILRTLVMKVEDNIKVKL